MDRTKVIVLLGRPGAGKGTQGELLRKKFGFVHISTGEILRAAIKEQSILGLQAKQFVERGCLVPDEIISSLVSARLKELCRSFAPGVIFDGFPRTVAQAESLQESIATLGIGSPFIVELRLSDSAASGRIEGRKLESGTEHRDDDRAEIVAARMEVYESQTRPVVEYYDRLGVLRVVDASGDKSDVLARIVETCGVLASNN